jgi:hypothetical protein
MMFEVFGSLLNVLRRSFDEDLSNIRRAEGPYVLVRDNLKHYILTFALTSSSTQIIRSAAEVKLHTTSDIALLRRSVASFQAGYARSKGQALLG